MCFIPRSQREVNSTPHNKEKGIPCAGLLLPFERENYLPVVRSRCLPRLRPRFARCREIGLWVASVHLRMSLTSRWGVVAAMSQEGNIPANNSPSGPPPGAPLPLYGAMTEQEKRRTKKLAAACLFDSSQPAFLSIFIPRRLPKFSRRFHQIHSFALGSICKQGKD